MSIPYLPRFRWQAHPCDHPFQHREQRILQSALSDIEGGAACNAFNAYLTAIAGQHLACSRRTARVSRWI